MRGQRVELVVGDAMDLRLVAERVEAAREVPDEGLIAFAGRVDGGQADQRLQQLDELP